MKKILAHIAAAVLLIWSCAPSGAQIVGTLPFQLQNGTVADATQVMADFNKILNDVNTNAAKNGVNTDITALNALVVPLTPAQGGSVIYFASTSGGSANAQTVATPTPVGFTLTVGKRVTFLAGFTNTGAMTLNVNATGATNVFRYTPAGPVALLGGEVVAGNYVEVVYDGTRFQLYTPAVVPGFGPQTTIAAAGTVDLGTASSHNVLISGTTTITAFGSSAITSYPIYRIKFDNALTLTHNGTSLILPGAANIVTAANDTAVVQYLGSGNWQVTSYSKASGVPVATSLPTRQGFSGGSGTYNTPANARYLRVRMVGGGGGGGGSGSGASAASSGGNTTFSTFTASGGSSGGGGGASQNAGGAGAGASGCNVFNQSGSAGASTASTTSAGIGGAGGQNAFFGGGGAGTLATGGTAATNSGGGGAGGFFNGSGTPAGAGGGAGGSCEGIINTPAASYSYAVGAGGGGGGAGASGNAGGAGAAGQIVVEEYY